MARCGLAHFCDYLWASSHTTPGQRSHILHLSPSRPLWCKVPAVTINILSHFSLFGYLPRRHLHALCSPSVVCASSSSPIVVVCACVLPAPYHTIPPSSQDPVATTIARHAHLHPPSANACRRLITNATDPHPAADDIVPLSASQCTWCVLPPSYALLLDHIHISVCLFIAH